MGVYSGATTSIALLTFVVHSFENGLRLLYLFFALFARPLILIVHVDHFSARCCITETNLANQIQSSGNNIGSASNTNPRAYADPDTVCPLD